MTIPTALTLLALLAQSPVHVKLEELARDPRPYDGRILEVRGVLHSYEESTFLCSPKGDDPGDLRDCSRLDLQFTDALSRSDEEKLDRASRGRGDFFWVTIRGRFEVSLKQMVGAVPIFNRTLWMTAVLKVERAKG